MTYCAVASTPAHQHSPLLSHTVGVTRTVQEPGVVALALGVNVEPRRQLHDVKVLLPTVTGSIHAPLQLGLVNHLTGQHYTSPLSGCRQSGHTSITRATAA